MIPRLKRKRRGNMSYKIVVLSIISVLFFFLSCESPYMVRHPVSAGDAYYLYATYYGDEFEGRTAADGSAFSQNELTCAARGFPFGTMLEVKSLATGKKIVVKVTDRPGKNVIDLSKKAFSEIDDTSKGKIAVKVKVVNRSSVHTDSSKTAETVPDNVSTGNRVAYTLQVYKFTDLDEAKKTESDLDLDCYIFAKEGAYFVRCGSFSTKEEAQQLKNELFSDKKDVVIVEIPN